MEQLTSRESELFHWLTVFSAQTIEDSEVRKQWPPTQREVATKMGVSVTRARQLLGALVSKGAILLEAGTKGRLSVKGRTGSLKVVRHDRMSQS